MRNPRKYVLAAAALLALVLCCGPLADLLRAGGGESPEEYERSRVVELPAPTAVAGQQIDLVGEECPEPSDPASSFYGVPESFSQTLPWVGEMRVTVSDPRVYPSAGAAGFAKGQSLGQVTMSPSQELPLVVLTVTFENVDATCQEWVSESERGQCIRFPSGFELYGDGRPYVADWIKGSSGFKDQCNCVAWPLPGEKATFTVGYYPSSLLGTGGEAASPKLPRAEYMMRLAGSIGDLDALPDASLCPVVDLGVLG